MELNINLNDLICDSFVDIADDIINCNVDRAVMNGGRSSTKSQVASECIITGCMVFKESAVAAVKYANKIEERLVNTFRDTIRFMGVESFWKLRRAPFEYVLLDEYGKETDVSIKFTGCDNPDNLKSYKSRRGGFRYIWFEELTNFPSLKEVNNLIQTFARGQGKHCVIMTYNPPMQTSSWVNKQYNVPIGTVLGHDTNYYYEEFDFEVVPGQTEKVRQVVHHSTYLDVIASGHADWLGLTFIGEAKKCEVQDNRYYRWAYLGEIVGTEANVFRNIRKLTPDLVFDKTYIYRGLDLGFTTDPSAYTEWTYNKRTNSAYCLGEFVKKGVSNQTLVAEIKLFNKHNFKVWTDSAEPRTINELNLLGMRCLPVTKGPDSVRHGVKWLQSLDAIYIDPVTCPETYREFSEYEYKLNRLGEYTGELVDANNHTIDSTRYAMSPLIS